MKPNDKAIEAARKAYCEAAVSPMEMALEAAYAAQFQSKDYANLIKDLHAFGNEYESITIYAADALSSTLAERDEWKGRQEATAALLKQVETERDKLKVELNKARDIARVQAERIGGYIKTIEDREAERDLWQRKQKETAKILGLAIDAILNRPTPVDGIRCLTTDEQDVLSEVISRAKGEKERDALRARLAPVDGYNLEIMAAKEFIEATTDMPPRTTYTISKRSLSGARAAIAAIRPHIEAAEREKCAKIAEGKYEKLEPASQKSKDYKNGRLAAAAAIRSGK